MDKGKLKIMMHKAQKGPISELNGCITCKLCKGYFIDATTIIECLHTFCRSCIVRYLESNKYCPICDVQVHKTKPLLSIRRDKTIQDLVYKLVPRLYQNEAKRRKLFYESNPAAKASISEEYMASQYEYILAPDEAINLTLNYSGCSSTPRYLRCPSAVLISHLKKLIQAKYELSDHHKVDVFYKEDILNPSLSLMDIAYIYSWKRKEPLDLSYKIYENRAKKPKLECTENDEGNANRSANNNNWKEVQLRISENGEMSITGIQDAGMLDLLDATENFKSEIVINEGKNMENYPKPVQVDSEIGNNEVRIQATHTVDTHSKAIEDGAKESPAATPNNSHSPENHLTPSKKELPELKLISKSLSGSISTSTNTKSVANTKLLNSGIKMVINNAKSGANVAKITSVCSDPKKSTISPVCTVREIPTTSTTIAKLSVAEPKTPKMSFANAMPKSMELSETLNLNSELSVIPLNASASCVSLSSCGGTTTVFSTINKSMCSTKSDESYSHSTGLKEGNDNKTFMNIDKELTVHSISKESNSLKRKCEDSDKSVEVPAKLPKPTILNHSIGLINLSNNHPLKKHSKMNRNGERRNPEMCEKMPISSANLTVSHALVTQKPNSLDKPLIINKNLNYLHLGRPSGNPKLTTAQKGSPLANVPCYMPKVSVNSAGGKASEKNGEKVEGYQEKAEGHTSMPKPSVSHPHVHTYQNTHHAPIITPAQLPHHQNFNSLQLKHSAPKDPVVDQDNVKTPSTTVTQDSKSNTGGPQANTQSTLATGPVKPTQKSSDGIAESLLQAQPIPSAPRSTTQTVDAITTVARSSPIPTASVPNCSSPTTIKTKPSTPIGYKTLRDPPKSWNSQINSQIARVNQNVKAQQLANAVAAASQGGGANAQGRYGGDLKSVRPAKFFKGRNMPRYLGNPASGVKPMYQVHVSPEKEKNQDQHTQNVKSEKSEIKKHSIVKIDPKTLKPISEKAPETSNLSNVTSSLVTQNNQELRINPSTGDLKINTSSVSIFNPLKLQQNSPKNERKSPKSPHSPKVKSNSCPNTAATTTTMSSNASSPMNALSPKQQRDKNSLTFTPSNPFVPNLASPTLNPNQFLYPAGGFPSYDPRFMAACHSLWYSQRMAAAAAAGLVPPPLPHAFGLNMGLNPANTIGQQPHSPGVAPKHSTPAKSTRQAPSPRSSNTANPLNSKSSPTPINKKIKESSIVKNEKSLETALEKLTQSKVKEFGGNKHLSNDNKGLVNSKDVRNGSPLHVVQKATIVNDNSYVDAHHKKPVAKGAAFNQTALEKLSHNKAIEILGAISGKGSPTVQEKDGDRNSPMTTSANKSVSGGNRLVDVLSGGRPLLPLTEQSTNSTGITKAPSPPIIKKDGQKLESNKIVEPPGTVRIDKEQKVPNMKTTSLSGDEKSEKSSRVTPTEIQQRLGQLEATPEGQSKGTESVQASCTDGNGATPRDKSDIKTKSERKQCTTDSNRVQCNDSSSGQTINVASDIDGENPHPDKKVIVACCTTDDAVNEMVIYGGASEKIIATKASAEKDPSAMSGEGGHRRIEAETSSSLAESSEDSGGGEKTSRV